MPQGSVACDLRQAESRAGFSVDLDEMRRMMHGKSTMP
jgi:hypothetical protein